MGVDVGFKGRALQSAHCRSINNHPNPKGRLLLHVLMVDLV
jgi:hypothetical protein